MAKGTWTSSQRSSLTLMELLKKYDIPHRLGGTHRHVREGWVGLNCPQCSPHGEKFRLGINLTTLGCSCWSCGKLRLWPILAAVVPPGTVLRGLIAPPRRLDPKSGPTPTPVGPVALPATLGALDRVHRIYLQKRGFDPDELTALWGVQGIGLNGGHLRWRLFIPIRLDGVTVSWTTRSVSDAGTRYISAGLDQESVPHKSLLFGEDYCSNTVIIHEGPFDVFRTGPGAVCTFGVKITDQQILRLCYYPIRVICYDNTVDGQQAARSLAASLEPFPGETHIAIPSGKDIASSPQSDVEKLRRFL